MNKSIIIYQKSEGYKQLIKECQEIISETKFDLAMKDLEWRHKLGEAIIKNPLYRKYGKKSGEFVKEIARDIGMQYRNVYYCLKFYEKFPKLDDVCTNVQTTNKQIRWAIDIKPLLGENPATCNHGDFWEEILEIKRQRCGKCNKVIKEEQILR